MIGKRLAKLRKNASLTQKELAKQLNLTLYAISAYENNRNEPPDSIKILFAKRFNVSIDYLLGNNPRECIDVSDLPAEVIAHIRLLIEDLRKTKKTERP